MTPPKLSEETTTNMPAPVSTSGGVTVTAEVLGPNDQKHSNARRSDTATIGGNDKTAAPGPATSNANATPRGPPKTTRSIVTYYKTPGATGTTKTSTIENCTEYPSPVEATEGPLATPTTEQPPCTDNGTTIYRCSGSFASEGNLNAPLIVPRIPTSNYTTRAPKGTSPATSVTPAATPPSFFREGVNDEELARAADTKTCETTPGITRTSLATSMPSGTPAVLSHLLALPYHAQLESSTTTLPANENTNKPSGALPVGTSATAVTTAALAILCLFGGNGVRSLKSYFLCSVSIVTALTVPFVSAQTSTVTSTDPHPHGQHEVKEASPALVIGCVLVGGFGLIGLLMCVSLWWIRRHPAVPEARESEFRETPGAYYYTPNNKTRSLSSVETVVAGGSGERAAGIGQEELVESGRLKR